MATDTIPITIKPEAAGQAAAYGMSRELDELIEHTRQVIPDLASIEVTRYVIFEEPELPRVVITARRRGQPGPEHRRLDRVWFEPICLRYSPTVLTVFHLDIEYPEYKGRCAAGNS